MTRQSSFVFSTLILSLVGTVAWADGMVQPGAPACCEASFAGAYIGAAVGYARQRVEVTNETVGAPAKGLIFSDNDGSVTFGMYVGYNWRRCCSPFVFGIETDFNYLDTSPTGLDIEPGPVATETASLESNMNWFGTLRGRAGYVVHDRLLLYATGGLAYAKVYHTLSIENVGASQGLNLGNVSASSDKTKVGWTVGGGAELLHDSNWLLRAEALYVDLGDNPEYWQFTLPGGFTGNANDRWDDQFWIARIGVAYKFGSPDCCAAPLK